MPKALIEAGTYTYTVQGDSPDVPSGTVLRLRRMSARERFDWLSEDAEIVNLQIQHYGDTCVDGCPTTDGRDNLFREVRKLAKRLLNGDDFVKLQHFKKSAHANDLWGFPMRIIQVEFALQADDTADVPEQIVIPDPRVVDDADEKRLAQIEEGATRLGESSEATALPTTTPTICSQAETSSNGSDAASVDTA